VSLAVWFGSAMAGILLVRWARRRWMVVTVRGKSMMPTLRDGQRLLVRRARGGAAQLQVGDIVVFFAPEREWPPGTDYLVKRVVALGDVIAPSVAGSMTETTIAEHPPSDSVMVLGDNLRASQDSRHFGPVDRRSIIGVVRRAAEAHSRRSAEAPGPGSQPPACETFTLRSRAKIT
jgi:signal peptidase I